MLKYNKVKCNTNKFLKEIRLKKQYLKKIKNETYALSKLKETNYKKIGLYFLSDGLLIPEPISVMYIIKIFFSKKNTLFHISDCAGNPKFFYSAGSFQFKGKAKTSRSTVLRKFYSTLISKLKFIKKAPISVHFKNTDLNMFWFLKKLRKKFFIVTVKNYNQVPYNGCRKKKIRRKKFKAGFLQL
jgi:ribosomal protein S11